MPLSVNIVNLLLIYENKQMLTFFCEVSCFLDNVKL